MSYGVPDKSFFSKFGWPSQDHIWTLMSLEMGMLLSNGLKYTTISMHSGYPVGILHAHAPWLRDLHKTKVVEELGTI